MTTIGIICEGTPGGEDEQVLTHLVERIVPGSILDVKPQGRKPILFEQCGLVAQALFESGCDRVLIVWDIFPRWGKPDGEQQDRADLQVVLAQAGLDTHPCLYLVPIKAELEAWLLADGSALSAVLSRPTRKAKIGDTKNIEDNTDPKKRLEAVFKNYGRDYTAKSHAIKIAENIPNNFGMLGKLNSFKNFGRSLTQPC